MAVSFGSVGDIIAVCLLVKDLADAFDKTRGSGAEYQGLTRELGSLERCLLQVDLLCRSPVQSQDIATICDAARSTIKDCELSLQDLYRRIQKYDRYLNNKGSGATFFANAAMKIRWQISEKDDIQKFRSTIAIHTDALSMLLATVNVKVAERNASKVEKLASETKSSANEISGVLVRIHGRLDETTTQLTEQKTIVGRITEGISRIRKICSDMQASLVNLLQLGTQTHQAVVAIQTQLPTRLERVLIDEPFILEDAIGRQAPVHLQFINSWDALHAVLEIRFRNIQGADKIERREYSLQDHRTGREISRSRPWEGAFLPGQRVDMSLIFQHKRSTTPVAEGANMCPGCRHSYFSSADADVECAHCGLLFRRIEEVEEVDSVPLEPIFVGPLPEPWRMKPVFGHSAFAPAESYARRSESQGRWFQLVTYATKTGLQKPELGLHASPR
ncbi:hypothetical protein B0T24DRAFT_390146 [Lasiosphaeria ovina]|uniref:Ubiquitin-like domain-containing protein n=1 Tax=Lasiosphaeria ovina TaxID=92902 RepID=A0AAE0JZT3_9PEZI|nr:hypothetical protein B0T24DRAFT_390146 [Lasiosphaeria ovina]